MTAATPAVVAPRGRKLAGVTSLVFGILASLPLGLFLAAEVGLADTRTVDDNLAWGTAVVTLGALSLWGGVPAALIAIFVGFAALVRGQLATLIVVYALSALFLAWTSERGRRWRAGWSRWDWVGFVVLAIGAIIVFSASVGAFSQTWLVATGHYRHRMIEYGLWAGGAFTIGVGPGQGTTYGAGASGNLNLAQIPGCAGQPYGLSFVDAPQPVTTCPGSTP